MNRQNWFRFFSANLAPVGLCVVLFLFAVCLQQAISKKILHQLTNTVPCFSMAIAISDFVYHLDQGYVTYAVLEKWCNRWFGGDTPAERLADADYINAAFRDATSIRQIATIAPSNSSDFRPILLREVVPEHAEDLGRVDYYKLAFLLFGYNVQGTNLLYFLILLVSSLLFWLGFKRDPKALSILFAAMIAENLTIQSNLFSAWHLPGISSYRGLSSLAIVPILHLMYCAYSGVSLRSLAGITAIAQAAIYVFAVWVRSSAQWGVIAMMSILVLALIWNQSWRCIRLAQAWPLALVLAGLLGLNLYTRAALNPAYFTEELLPQHFVWHSAFLGLSLHPQWPGPERLTDNIAWKASETYLKSNRPDLPADAPLTGNVRLRTHDLAIRAVFFEFARKHPWFMVELYAWYKPASFLGYYWDAIKPILRGGPFLGAVLSILFLGGFFVCWPVVIVPALTITGALALSTLAPLIWAYPALYLMTDSFLATTAFLLVLFATGFSFLISRHNELTQRLQVSTTPLFFGGQRAGKSERASP